MTDPERPARRTGGRSARVQDQVEGAALAVLLDAGYSGLTIRAVAQAAGVAETTVYRRWPTVGDLAAAALLRLAARGNPIPDTGSLVEDLRLLLTQVTELLARPEVLRVVRSAVVAEGDAARHARNAFFQQRFAASSVIVERAIARGELPPDTDGLRLIESLVGPAYMRALFGYREIDDDFVESSIASVLATVR
ncbi:TetR/AcrR family transcriptional regulator [Gordonia phthalatica]|uniref:TetR/AcrR family transcriptional regulator n=1 Tax=Gordonia phthalatica TaxID=1136941 RepID=UPI00138F3A60|nr:TetR/AcrR family transcriptional regulator [Gordonia phthalatica]